MLMTMHCRERGGERERERGREREREGGGGRDRERGLSLPFSG